MAVDYAPKRSNQPFDTCTFEGYFNAGLPHCKQHGCITNEELTYLSSFLDRRKDGIVEVTAVANLTRNFGDKLTRDEAEAFKKIADPKGTGRAELPVLIDRLLQGAILKESTTEGLKMRSSQIGN